MLKEQKIKRNNMEAFIISLLVFGLVTMFVLKPKKIKKIFKSSETNSVQIDKDYDDLTRKEDLIDEENILKKAKKK